MIKKLTRATEVLGVLALLWIWGFSTYLENNRPSHPTGQFNVQVPVHGSFIYVAQSENLLRVLSWPLFFVLVIVSLSLEILGRGKR